MSLDEVGKNEFYIACLYLVKDIIRDVEKREGFNMDRNNYHLLTDDEIFILGLYNILNSIENCLFSIENASIFMKHFFGKNYFDLKSATPFPKCYLHKEKWTFDS